MAEGLTPEERAKALLQVLVSRTDGPELPAIAAHLAQAHAEGLEEAALQAHVMCGCRQRIRAILAPGPSAGQPSGDAKGSAQALADVVIDFLSSHGGSECAGRGECVCDDAWPAVGLAWGDLEGARRRNSKRGAQP